jgi:hypothetical protein
MGKSKMARHQIKVFTHLQIRVIADMVNPARPSISQCRNRACRKIIGMDVIGIAILIRYQCSHPLS